VTIAAGRARTGAGQDVQGACCLGGHAFPLRERRQIDEPHPVEKPLRELRSDLQRHTGRRAPPEPANVTNASPTIRSVISAARPMNVNIEGPQ
jgi:hypothetical protein